MIDADRPDIAHRLHPMTLIQRLLVSLPGFALLLLPVLRHPDRDAWLTLIITAAYGVVTLPWIILHYQRFRYRITPDELIIQSGVLTRQHRNIPIERIQNIEIEQRLLPRLFGTARVKVETAGSTRAEGVLEYVGLQDAHRIRSVVRSYQRRHAGADAEKPPAEEAATGPTLLFTMSISDLLYAGAFRFSIIYIAVFLSALQYWEPDPTALADWMARGRLSPFLAAAMERWWLTALVGTLLAATLSWVAGILVTFNRYYGFRLWRDGEKLLKSHGLLTVVEGTIPVKKIQTLILRSNPLMRRFGWYRLKLQTMGIDEKQGHQVAVPFARLEHLIRLAPSIYPFTLPQAFHTVSRLHIRRTAIRYTVVLLGIAMAGAYLWRPALGLLAAAPLLLGIAVWQYRNHGYAVEDGLLFVRRGVLRHRIWVIPVEKFQVFYAEQSIFQHRLGLKTLHIDTAGASPVAWPAVVDLPAEEADALLEALYTGFRLSFERRRYDVREHLQP